ncbi:HIT domain-containing protein [Gellertiella hungarica]|uniref:Diadenosine tetraphosphate (Ap4A) HIT family hydrolase n=1 Tax=Gellertiella hungarica TaxID=1572859 RepID=A0A7W6NLV9_9HYPH|nr:HIT family protein [Gellertiella hungarica]MBB4065845.1 diadenosine tetraphosphate (Ap4A) HIT family hydrolase [Gellertiella hungarica]
MQAFQVDERLDRDSQLLLDLALCQVRLMNDARWPWLILVPRRPAVCELFDLSAEDQQLAAAEANRVAALLKGLTGADKINVAAIGNIVRQLHIHVVARSEGDPNWPRPVWGFGTAEPYGAPERDAFITRIRKAFSR